MEDNRLNRVFDQVKLSSEREEAMLADLLMEQKEASGMKQTNKRRIPAAALAAALVVVLAGTAFAAGSEAVAGFIERLTLQVFSGGEDIGYTVSGDSMTKYPLSAFSLPLLEASENRDGLAVVDLWFDTWDEVRDFLGRDIPCIWPDSGEGWAGPYHIYLFHTGSDQLWGVDICNTQTTDVVLSQIKIQIRTEYWQGMNASAGLRDRGGEGCFTPLGGYHMSNGAEAELVQYTGPEDCPHANCEGFFMTDGILYNVTSYGTNSTLEETVSRLYKILDAFP